MLNELWKQESGPAVVFPAPCTCAVEAQTPSPAIRHPRHAFAGWLRALRSGEWRLSPQRRVRRLLQRQLAACRRVLCVPAQTLRWTALGSVGAEKPNPPPSQGRTGHQAAVSFWAPWLASLPHNADCIRMLRAVCRFLTINCATADETDYCCAHGMGRQAHNAVFEKLSLIHI